MDCLRPLSLIGSSIEKWGHYLMIENVAWMLTGREEFTCETSLLGDVRPGWARIKVAYCGICGSDLHSYQGLHPNVHPPIVLGHEFSGIVTEVGNEKDSGLVGASVVVVPSVPCNNCYQCRNGKEHICEKLQVVGNIGIAGAFSRYVDIPADRILKIPETINLAQAALVEPTAVAIHALDRAPLHQAGVVVIGAGPIGMITALVAKAHKTGPVTIMDIRPDRLAMAQRLGIDSVIHSEDPARESRLQAIYPDGPDAVFDCVAVTSAVNLAVRIARKGSTIVLVGVPAGSVTLDAIFIQDRELQLVGTLMYQVQDFERAIQLISQPGTLPVLDLVSRKISFEDVPQGFRQLLDRSRNDLKILVEM